MDNFLLDNGDVLVETEISQLSVRPGVGCYRIELDVTLSPTRHTPEQGRLTLRGGQADLGRSTSGNSSAYLGEIHIAGNPTISLSQRCSVEVNLVLSPLQLSEIRNRTTGGDVWITVHLQGFAVTQEPGEQIEGHAQIKHKIPQSDWLRQLEYAGFAEVLLIEVTTPPSDAPANLKASVSKLKKAQALFHQGDYEGSVAACRKALEALYKGLEVNPKEAEEAFKKDRRGMTLYERKLLLRHILRHYTHPAHHADERSIDPHYTRSDAQLALTSTAA